MNFATFISLNISQDGWTGWGRWAIVMMGFEHMQIYYNDKYHASWIVCMFSSFPLIFLPYVHQLHDLREMKLVSPTLLWPLSVFTILRHH